MEIEVRSEGDVTILLLKGTMVGGQGDELLRDKVERLVKTGQVRIHLDMAGVPDNALAEVVGVPYFSQEGQKSLALGSVMRDHRGGR